MMKLMLSASFILFTLAGIAQEKPSKPNPAKTEAIIFRNSTLALNRGEANDSVNIYPKMSKGSMWVLQYNYQAPEYPEMSDDEYFESFTFQLSPPKTTSFVLKGASLAKANAVFQKACFCADRGYFIIKEGTVTGKKINNSTWLISVDIVIPPKGNLSSGAIRKKFTARYKIPTTPKK